MALSFNRRQVLKMGALANATATQNLSRDGSGPLLEVSNLRVYYGQSLIVKDLSLYSL
jgi:hypothetical protein